MGPKPRTLCTPFGLFLECLTVVDGKLLTCVCMLRLLKAGRCAEVAPLAPWLCCVIGWGAFVNAAPGLTRVLWMREAASGLAERMWMREVVCNTSVGDCEKGSRGFLLGG